MTQDSFTKLEAKDATVALADVNPLLDGPHFVPATVTVLAQRLSFWPGWRLLDIGDFTQVPVVQCQAVQKRGTAVILDGSVTPVYQLNGQVPLSLLETNVPAYIRFFFAYVRGPSGRFTVVETIDDIPWREEPSAPVRKDIGLRALPLVAARAFGGFYADATLLSGNALFKARVSIAADGAVTIGNEELLIEDLPAVDSVLNQ